MAERMGNMRRTHYCGEVLEPVAGAKVTVAGFVQRQRDKGNLIFIDLRDRTGIVQLTFDDTPIVRFLLRRRRQEASMC